MMRVKKRERKRGMFAQILFKIFFKEVELSDGTRGVKASTISVILIIFSVVAALILCTKYGVMDDITGIIRAIRGA